MNKLATLRSLVGLALMLTFLPARAAEPVDLLLVLASDVSRSVDDREFQLQREGYAAALADKRVLHAISSGLNRRIAVTYVEWSGSAAQKVVVNWTLVDGVEAARLVGNQLIELPRSSAGRTSISGGIDFSITLFDHAPFAGSKRTIDVSGDGTNNSGRDVKSARDQAVAEGITINGLAISSSPPPVHWNPEHTSPPGGLTNYYRENVIGGKSAFVIAAENFQSFGQALVKKLIAEIAQAKIQ